MPNNNCLEGMKCPKCGYEEHFKIVARVWVDAYDDEVSIDEYDQDFEWTDTSWCICKNCGYGNEVGKFKENSDD